MKYHIQSKGLTIGYTDLEYAAQMFLWSIKQIRIACNLPLDKYTRDGGLLTDADHAMRGIIEGADRIGIDLGARWGNELDVRDVG